MCQGYSKLEERSPPQKWCVVCGTAFIARRAGNFEHFWTTHSRLKPLRKVIETMRRLIIDLVIVYKHSETNAASDGFHNKIQKIRRMTHGFQNIAPFKTTISFHYGGLDLHLC